MKNFAAGNQRAGPAEAPDPPRTRGSTRSLRGAAAAGFLLAALVLTLGALGGTAAAGTDEGTARETTETQVEARSDAAGDREDTSSPAGSSSHERTADAVSETQAEQESSWASTEQEPVEAHSNTPDVTADTFTPHARTVAPEPDPVADTSPSVTRASATTALVEARETVAEAVEAALVEARATVAEAVETARVSLSSHSETTDPVSSLSMEDAPAPPMEAGTTSSGNHSQCNPPAFPDTAGWEVSCDVVITNTVTVDPDTGDTDESHQITTTTCLAATGVLPPAGCTTVIGPTEDGLHTTVNQCNGIVNGGGSNVTCNVTMTNVVPEGTDTTVLTVNQCNGTGGADGSPVDCAPVAATDGAMINQCNGSANGGGSTVNCNVFGDTTAIPLTIDQCNGTANGGGDTVTCNTTVQNVFTEPAAGDTPPDGTPPDGTPPDGTGPGGTGPGGTGPGGTTPGGNPSGGNPSGGNPSGGNPSGGNPSGGNPSGGNPSGGAGPDALSTTQAAAGPASMNGASPALIRASTVETSGLPATGSDVRTMAAMGLLAMMFGGLLMLTSRSARKVRANH